MRILSSILGGLLGAAMVSIGACGGEVTSSTSTGSAGGTGGSGATSTGTGNPTGGATKQPCLDFCHKLETMDCFAQLDDCNEYCDPTYYNAGAECADELDAVYTCWLPKLTSCPDQPPPECKAEDDTFKQCQDMYGCVPGECYVGMGPDGAEDCGCTKTCGMKSYETMCKKDAAGSSCDCLIDGMSVGQCDPGAQLECSTEAGCCKQYFEM
jgi:hypothetical protein